MTSEPPSDPPLELPGDRGSFDEIIKAHLDYLHLKARHLAAEPELAKDLVHDTVVRAKPHFEKFTQGTNARAWLATILTRVFLDHRKRMLAMRRALDRLSVETDEETELDTALHATLLNISDEQLHAAIAALDRDQRRLVDLCYLQGKLRREVATEMGIKPGTVASRLYSARQKLMTLLQDRLEKTGKR